MKLNEVDERRYSRKVILPVVGLTILEGVNGMVAVEDGSMRGNFLGWCHVWVAVMLMGVCGGYVILTGRRVVMDVKIGLYFMGAVCFGVMGVVVFLFVMGFWFRAGGL